jgi:hypothetical protein
MHGQRTKTQQPRSEETESTQEKTGGGRTLDNHRPDLQEAVSAGAADLTDEPVYLDQHLGMAAQ